MKFVLSLVALVLAALGVYVIGASYPFATSPDVQVIRPAAGVPIELAALSGIWEGIGPDAVPSRLVVEDIHENWANIRFTWGGFPEIRAKARVLPEGGLYWRQTGGITFQLSEDWTTLVAIREQAGKDAVSLLQRMPRETGLAELVVGGGN